MVTVGGGTYRVGGSGRGARKNAFEVIDAYSRTRGGGAAGGTCRTVVSVGRGDSSDEAVGHRWGAAVSATRRGDG